MSQDASFFTELTRRRVPQIVGVYVAATWMMVEIGDWAADRLGVAPQFTTVLFILMAAMLPSVILFTWNHGAPGRDAWRSAEKIFIPINAVAAVLLLTSLLPTIRNTDTASPVAPASAATVVEAREIVDETGERQVFEVPAIDYYERVGIFPFEFVGDETNEWLAHGVPVLLQADLNRSSFIDLDSIFEVVSVDRLRSSGFPDGLGIPRALRLNWLRKRLTSLMLDGSIEQTADGFVVRANLVDVTSGEITSQFEAAGAELLAVLEEMSDRLRVAITPQLPDQDTISTDLALSEHFTTSVEAARLFVAARVAIYFSNDYAGAIERLQEAIELDPGFAVANASLANNFRASGQVASAMEAYERALTVDYKLSSEQRFLIKANRYAISGQTEKAIRVLEMLVEVHPYSANSFAVLANNYANVDRPADAEQAFLKVRELDPSADQVLLALADLSQMVRSYDSAQTYVQEYIDAHPQDARPVLKLGGLLWLVGDSEGARRQYERAAILDSNDFASEMALAKLEKWEANFDGALARFALLEARDLGSGEQLQVSSERIQVLQFQGRIEEGLALVERLDQAAGQTMMPVQRIFTIVATDATLKAQAGQFERAIEELDGVAAQVQPPFDGFLHMSRMTVYQQARDDDAFKASLAAFDAFQKQFSFPMLNGFLLAGKGYEAYLEERYDAAVDFYEQAQALFQRSTLGLVDSYVADYLTRELAMSLRATGRVDEAVILTRNHLDRYRADNWTRIEHIRNLIAADRTTEALEEIALADQIWAQADPTFIGLGRLDEVRIELVADEPGVASD